MSARGMLGHWPEVGLSSALLAFAGCVAEVEPRLVLSGPAELRAASLGPLPEASVALTDGTEPDGVIWTVSHPDVIDVQGNRVVVVGPGEARVTAEWEGDRVGFHIVVALDTRLGFVDAPERMRVGDTRALVLSARIGDTPVDPGPIAWSSSDPDVLVVDQGTVTAALPGTAWVTARARGASAMLELRIEP